MLYSAAGFLLVGCNNINALVFQFTLNRLQDIGHNFRVAADGQPQNRGVLVFVLLEIRCDCLDGSLRFFFRLFLLVVEYILLNLCKPVTELLFSNRGDG